MSDETLHIKFDKDEVAWRTKNGVVTESLTMRDHLEKLVGVGMGEPYCCSCVFCGNAQPEKHEPDCAWIAAKAFLEGGCMP